MRVSCVCLTLAEPQVWGSLAPTEPITFNQHAGFSMVERHQHRFNLSKDWIRQG